MTIKKEMTLILSGIVLGALLFLVYSIQIRIYLIKKIIRSSQNSDIPTDPYSSFWEQYSTRRLRQMTKI